MGNCFRCDKNKPSLNVIPVFDYSNPNYTIFGIKVYPPKSINTSYTSAKFPSGWTCVAHRTDSQQATYYDTYGSPRFVVFISSDSNYSRVRFFSDFDKVRIGSHKGIIDDINWFNM